MRVKFFGTSIVLLVTVSVFVAFASSPTEDVRAQEPDWAFLNMMGLPWRCGEVEPRTISQGWEEHWKRSPKGGAAIDFNASNDSDDDKDVLALFMGRVSTGESKEDYGKYVLIEADNGWSVRLAHLKSFLVEDDATVEKGQAVGRSDDTGEWSRGPHIHLELYWKSGKPDPKWFTTNTDDHFLFSHPIKDFLVPSDPKKQKPTQFYSNNCGIGPTTTLYWERDWGNHSTHYVGFGKFQQIPEWFDNQASSLTLEEKTSVFLYEDAKQKGGVISYTQDLENFGLNNNFVLVKSFFLFFPSTRF